MACGIVDNWRRYAATPSVLAAIAAFLVLPATAQELTTAAVNAGGGLTNGGEVENAGSFGAFGEITAGDDITARAGFPGQIYDPDRVSITPGSAALTDNSSTLFSAEVVCDDDSRLAPDSLIWTVNSLLLTVSNGGEVTAGLLPSDFSATLTAAASGVSGTAALSVFDTTPDDFGLYAGDGLPDAWQAQHFGLNSPDAAPTADPDADGQDNLMEYLAGTNPADPFSQLRLRFAGNPAPGTRIIAFSPFLPDRIYTLESSTIVAAPWIPLPGTAGAGPEPYEGSIPDTAATDGRKFYRLRITVP